MLTHPQDVETAAPAAQETEPIEQEVPFPQNRNKAIVVTLVALVLIGLAVGLGVGLSNKTDSPTDASGIGIRPNPGGSIVISAGIYVLENSNGEELLTISFVSTTRRVNATAIPAGRSYDGYDWEPVYPLLFSFDCNGGGCTVDLLLDEDGHYVIESFISQPVTPEQAASRLLTQGTFGPTEATILDMVSNGVTPEAWVAAQIAEPATLHRAHYRKRSNPKLRQPTDVHGIRNPCAAGSRWNRFAFSESDVGKTIATLEGNETTILKIDGIARTEVDGTFIVSPTISQPYVICSVSEYVGGPVTLGTEGSNDTCNALNTGTLNNPPVEFLNGTGIPDAHLVDLSPTTLDTKLLNSWKKSCVLAATGPLFVRAWSNPDFSGQSSYYIHDKRLVTVDNAPGSSAVMAADARRSCPRAPKTFLNEDTCIPAQGQCSPITYSKGSTMELNATTLRQFYLLDGLYVYRINNLQIQDNATSPCVGGWEPYRWVRKNATNDTNGCPGGDTSLNSNVTITLVDAINATLQTKADPDSVRVLDVVHTVTCSDGGSAIGAQVSVGASCWTHSHPDEWGVFDFSLWTVLHLGNPSAFENAKPNPIANVAEKEPTANLDDSVTLNFPGWHPKERWEEEKSIFSPIGLWADTVDFSTLPAKVQGAGVASWVDASAAGWSNDGFEICGSPGEVANDPSSGHQYRGYRVGDQGEVSERTLDQDHAPWFSKGMVWSTVAMNGADQLRQRVAWALSEIFIVTESDIEKEQLTEPWAAYYDIFVRHAFGNFRDVLKEVAFSPMMGIMLTYYNSKSLAHNIEERGAFLFPDENFAREIMQLFTLGLWKLNADGTKLVDDSGDPISTYDNNDITEFARGWTGLELQLPRSNLEVEWDLNVGNPNYIDPMRVTTKDGRDVFPKLGLDDGGRVYIGDGVQRCDAMPPGSFLRKGAKYRYLGSDSSSDLGRADPEWWKDYNDKPQLVLSETSDLFAALCNAKGGKCQFRSTVILNTTLPCDGNCKAGQLGSNLTTCECDVDAPRVVRLDSSATTGSSLPTYYEYVRAPCIEMAFPEAGNSITVSEIAPDGRTMCADARLPVAGGACCDSSGNVFSICVFRGERVTYATAKKRCEDIGMTTCPWISVETNVHCGTDVAPWDWNNPRAGMYFTWTNSSCSMQAQINKKGNVAIIHDVAPLTKPVKGRVAPDSGTYFRVLWNGTGSFPTASSNCTSASCQVQGTTCVCDTKVTTSLVFDGAMFPTRGDLIAQLRIGAPDPAAFDSDTYHACQARLCIDNQNNFRIYTKSTGPITGTLPFAFDEHTIFEILDPSGSNPPTFLLNSASTVNVGGGFEFRNPPMYNSPVDQTQRDALYETDAILDHYMGHSNVAPFIATRLIQLLITSNPSPRYVKRVAQAFKSGLHNAESVQFGTGQYGDMAAMTAAIYLDREARSTTLDLDATSGKVREPLLKVMHFLRAMELGSNEERELNLAYLDYKMGQEPHKAQSVFSFFSPNFQPVGPVNDKGLVSPESQLLDAPNIIGFINGLASLPAFGLSDCESLEGLGEENARFVLQDHPEEGQFSCDQARDFDPATAAVPHRLHWKPPSWGGNTNVNGASAADVIANLDLLLTGGRLHSWNRDIIEQAYANTVAKGGVSPDVAALRVAQMLFAITPEFSITNQLMNDKSIPEIRNTTEEPLPTDPPPVEGYKAIIYVFMNGAMDSFSLLVPNSGCTPSNLHQQYQDTRDVVALEQGSLLSIDVPNGTQPCNVFGVHPSLPTLKALYDDGDATFLANVGPLVEPLTKVEYEMNLKEQPPSLFAHNTQQSIAQTVHAQDSRAGGVLGRIGDAINAQESELLGESVEIFDAYSVSGTPKILEGAPGISRVADVLSSNGVKELVPSATAIHSEIRNLTATRAASIFGETYSERVSTTFNRVEHLGGVLNDVPLATSCSQWINNATDLAKQFFQVAKIITSRDKLEAKRDVFFIQHYGYDTHADNGTKLAELLTEVNDALHCFSEELKSQQVWNNVTIVTASEFGRTLTPNGLGTDHAWGGNYFVAGGSVKGTQILGEYPDDLTDTGPLNIGRGRLIPTTSWEAVWNAVARWFGVSNELMSDVLPNLANFPTNEIFDENEMFV